MAILGATTLTGCNSIPDFIGTGSIWVFHQTAAPTSWTKITTLNDRTLRVTNSTVTDGGTNPFTTTLTSSRSVTISAGAYTLTWPEMAVHAHPLGHTTDIGSDPALTPATARSFGVTDNRGGNVAHAHPGSPTTANFSVKYIDVIFASKN